MKLNLYKFFISNIKEWLRQQVSKNSTSTMLSLALALNRSLMKKDTNRIWWLDKETN